MGRETCAGQSEFQQILPVRYFSLFCFFLSSRECLEKFGDDIGTQVWDAVNECFDVMPLAATVDDRVSWGCAFVCTSLAIIIIIIDRFYWSLLYSAILRTPADSLRSYVILHEWIASFFLARFWISTEVVYLQRWHGWCHKNLLPERVDLGAFCVHHTTMHRVTSCKATYIRCVRV